ncbi:DUF4062 domain-containing protein [Lysobacter sp. CFH 32150]|uniref:DUF4062 domain-containing protein n=1 Tax=Lysobacter sp. CFH 32150 TaxID=2927128 RepID=UPI001FA771E5|nr:DUF4062 domain-containing protein [Lysobacter sp. CFH 32150]MCI4569303.1 DUF4062 domain-containing protein [Lysobacter sp. CFH 32150]
MTDTRRFVKVFLASPGDLGEERKAAKSAVDEFNALLAETYGCQVELVGWEDTVSVFGRPQETINRELERCELFIGMMWRKWGSPPDSSGKFSSGFEEEFRTSVERRKSLGRPEISMFFKEVGEEFTKDPGDQLKRVLEFKAELIDGKALLFEGFLDAKDFERKFFRCITNYVRRLAEDEAEKSAEESQAPRSTAGGVDAADVDQAEFEGPFSIEGAKFIREFVSKTERPNKGQITDVDIARFRLLGSLLKEPANDANTLGVHDANLLYRAAHSRQFGHAEYRGLLSAGFRNVRHENAPLWTWLTKVQSWSPNAIIWATLGSDAEERAGALSIMRLAEEPIHEGAAFDRQTWIESWLSEDTTSAVKVAALSYLAVCGNSADVPRIRQEFDRSDSTTVSVAADAIIRIHIKDGRNKALASLYELRPASVNKGVLRKIFYEHGSEISAEALLEGVTQPCAEVRRIAAELTYKRGILTLELADVLISDSDARVRLFALKALTDAGRTISNDQARQILLKPNQKNAFTLSGGFNFAGDAAYSEFKRERLMSLPMSALSEIVSTESVFAREGMIALSERKFRSMGADLRRSVDDQFEKAVVEGISDLVRKYGEGSQLVADARRLENHLRKDYTRLALSVLCQKSDPSDLSRIRASLGSRFVEYSACDVEYMRKFGEWADIPLLIDSLDRVSGLGGLLIGGDDDHFRAVARAMYELGRERLPDLFLIPAPDRLRAYVLLEVADKLMRDLPNSFFLSLLKAESDFLRKVVVLKCVRALPKARLEEILSTYLSAEEYRYYNVIHWLDMAVSLPKSRSAGIAAKVLMENWG